jgi:hypothetical protein
VVIPTVRPGTAAILEGLATEPDRSSFPRGAARAAAPRAIAIRADALGTAANPTMQVVLF